MGNTACCQNPNQESKTQVIVPAYNDHDLDHDHDRDHNHGHQHTNNNNNGTSSEPEVIQSKISLPDIPEKVRTHLQNFKPFQDKFQSEYQNKRFANLVYNGPLNNNGKPQGYGKMYYPNGSVFLGSFTQGKATGLGHYIFPDGSYYHGNLDHNHANDPNGIYQENGTKYTGMIKDNKMQGHGVLEGQGYRYEGDFDNGRIMKGTLKWQERERKSLPFSKDEVVELADFLYEGEFNEEGQFHGTGTLTDAKGKYTGNFQNGKKHGQGKYQFTNKLRYEGRYKNNLKDGQGTLFSPDGKIAYCGSFANGLPHGRGWIPLPDGTPNYLEFNEGISNVLSEEKKK